MDDERFDYFGWVLCLGLDLSNDRGEQESRSFITAVVYWGSTDYRLITSLGEYRKLHH